MAWSKATSPEKLPTYKIERSPAASVPSETHPIRTKVSLLATWTLWTIYAIFQILIVQSFQKKTNSIRWRMWAALFAEFCLSFQELVHALNLILILFGAPDKPPRPVLLLVGDAAPTVAVMITCCGEPADVIVDTIFAAAWQEYPPGRHSVYVLDDGDDKKLREAVEAVDRQSRKRGRATVTYLSRVVKPGTRSYFKAGNLQFGIERTKRCGHSDLLAGLDADMIPDKLWLRKMVPHLLDDEKTALAIPPQDYYNVPHGDPLGQRADFSMYFTLQEPLNDRLDACMCTGTGYVVKRKALETIGGWPLAETGEDFMCSSMLSDAGWKIAFVRQRLQSGLAPDSLQGLVKQRMRWIIRPPEANLYIRNLLVKTDAGIEVHQYFNYYLPGSKSTSQMTPGQRAVGVLYILRDYAPLTNIAALILLPVVLLTNGNEKIKTVASGQYQQKAIAWLRVIFLIFYIMQKINLLVLYHHIGLSRVLNFQSNEIWAAPYMFIRCIASCLPTRYNQATFVVCGTVTSAANERSHLRRQPLPWRIMSPNMLLYALYIVYASVPLFLRFSWETESGLLGLNLAMLPFPGVWVKHFRSISNMTVPLRYMIWPPTVPERADLLTEDEDGLQRPGRDWERNRSGNGAWWIGTVICELWIIWCC